ncbi:MAG: DUF3330 domain-containing protein, partial [Gammaproteobacteria bacterium]|nr:DUF3330 domain-containing protein [Gammaproteobacteria bacterium]
MNNSVQPDKPVTVSCEECLKEVPSSEAKMEEAGDYVQYFCGLDCYKIWRERSNKEDKEDK